jgi:uncharacterized repeat protein (TIGR03803 family)
MQNKLSAGSNGMLVTNALTPIAPSRRILFSTVGFVAILAFAVRATASTPTEKILYSFHGGNDGANPVSGLVADAAGNLYGTTTYGGPGPCTDSVGIVIGCGTVFELIKPSQAGAKWTEVRLYSFQGSTSYPVDTGYPQAGLVFDSSGNLYGTTFGGTGSYYDTGTVFELSPPKSGKTWTKTTLYSFLGGPDGANPRAGVVFDQLGNLYGSTSVGAPITAGTVFRLTPPTGTGKKWTETVLYAFYGGDDGQNPAGLAFDANGNLYGTTAQGGGFSVGGDVYNNTWLGGGTIFELTPSSLNNKPWIESQLFVFPPCEVYGSDSGGYCGSSDLPLGSLILDSAGNLYGTSELGLPYDPFCSRICTGSGTVFELVRPTVVGGSWTQNILYTFDTSTSPDAQLPVGNLVFEQSGNLYGTAAGGCASQSYFQFCASSQGAVFELSPPAVQGGSWTETLYQFQGSPDGAGPAAGLLPSGSTFYSTTQYGGSGNCPHTESQPTGCGTVFQITY